LLFTVAAHEGLKSGSETGRKEVDPDRMLGPAKAREVGLETAGERTAGDGRGIDHLLDRRRQLAPQRCVVGLQVEEGNGHGEMVDGGSSMLGVRWTPGHSRRRDGPGGGARHHEEHEEHEEWGGS
jgi:hypothetical protein